MNIHQILKTVFVFICSILLFANCNNKKDNSVKISYVNFEDEVALQQNLTFVFNKVVMNVDSLIGNWLSSDYLIIEPKVDGYYKWNSPQELVFSPTKGFLPATTYDLQVSNQTLQHSKKVSKLSGQTNYQFHTSYLNIESLNTQWLKDEQTDKVVLQTELDLNIPIDPERIKDKIHAEIGKKKIPIQLKTSHPSNKIVFQLIDLDPVTKKSKLTVKIEDKAITGNSNGIKKSIEIESVGNLTISDIKSEHNGLEGIITVYPSQPITSEQAKKHLSISPKINFNIEASNGKIIVRSEKLNPDKEYTITVSKKIEGVLGGKLKDHFSKKISFGKIAPQIAFENEKGRFLSTEGKKNIAVKIVNVPKVKVTISKVFENNLLSFNRQGKTYDWYYEYNEEEDYSDYFNYTYYNTNDLGQTIYEKEIETNTLPSHASGKILNLNFEDKLKDYKGIYVIDVKDVDKRYLSDSKIISLSDLGLIVKEDASSVYVFINSILTAKSLSGVKVNFISSDNQIIGSATSGSNGIAVFNKPLHLKNFKLRMITAEKGEDFNYLNLNEHHVNTARFDVGGKRINDQNYDLYLYGERDLYRPGETIHMAGIVRQFNWKKPESFPIKAKLSYPNGKEFKTIKKVLNEEGAFEVNFTPPASAITGNYSFEVFSGNDVLLASKSISVEEFMPDRIKVELNTNKEEYYPGESISAEILATNYFGPPAADRNYELEMTLYRSHFSPEGLNNFNFNVSKKTTLRSIYNEGQTDQSGNAKETITIDKKYTDMGVLQGRLYATVFDETGRPVNRAKRFKIITQEVFYGIGYTDYFTGTNQALAIPLIAVNKDGKPLDGAIGSLKIVRKKWETILKKDGNKFKYVSQPKNEVLVDKKVTISGENTVFYFTPKKSGRYEIYLNGEKAKSYVDNSFYAYGYDDTYNRSFEVNNEGHIDIELSQEACNVGDKVDVLLKMPFTGKVLVTTERDKILSYFYLDATKKAMNFSLPIKSDHLPNIYITATLIKPNSNTAIPMTVAHGFASLKVEDNKHTLPLSISCAEKSRSQTKQTIQIKSAPNTEIALAIVDQGILAIKNQKSPSPYDFFFAKRALEVNSADLYPYLYPEITASGGDGFEAEMMDKRTNPMDNKRVKLVSFWSGLLKTDNNGNLDYEIEIPQFSGSLRLMAVAYKGDRFSDEQKEMIIADPIVMSSSIPRFLSPGDKLTMPVTLSNTTNKKAKGDIRIALEGPLKPSGPIQSNISIDPNNEQQVILEVEAVQDIGQGKITVTANALGSTFKEITDITVRPAAPLVKSSASGSVASGDSKKVATSGNYIPTSVDQKLIISKSPMVQFTKNLEYLSRYPYGCIEQTVSRSFPQIYFNDLVKHLGNEVESLDKKNALMNVQAGIQRVSTMQLSNGGFSYWPSRGYESWWSTAYATHFLIEAKKAGFEVDRKMYNKALNYLKSKVKKIEKEVYYYNGTKKKEIVKKELAYSLYVLALAGKADLSTMNYYKSNPQLLSLDSKYLIACAYTLLGDNGKAQQILPAAFSGEKSVPVFGGSFYSPIRDMAIALNALLDADPNNEQINYLAKEVSSALQNKRYLNTQETAFGFLAMGKLSKQIKDYNATADILVSDQKIAHFDGQDLVLNTEKIKSNDVIIKAAGNGSVYYFLEKEGIPIDGSYKEEDKFLKVRKKFFTRDKKTITTNKFNQNDLVIVEVTLQSLNGKHIENVAITDMLPAGFEIENARLTEMPDLDWINENGQYDHKDIRDDRINIFATATPTEKKFYYMVRAVSTGTFQMGPVSADAMYNGAYHSYWGGRSIIIE